mgnify:CR=1 FL=1
MTALLEAQSVSMTIGGTTLVDAVSLQIGAGEMVAIVGPNGAGKSTLLRMLSGDLKPSHGTIRLKQRDLHGYAPRELARHRAMLSQHVHVTFPFTVEEIIAARPDVLTFHGVLVFEVLVLEVLALEVLAFRVVALEWIVALERMVALEVFAC